MGQHYAAAESHPDAIYLTSQTVDTITPEPDIETARQHARQILADNPGDSFCGNIYCVGQGVGKNYAMNEQQFCIVGLAVLAIVVLIIPWEKR